MYEKHNRSKKEKFVRDEKTAATLTTCIKMQISFTRVYIHWCVSAKSSCITKLWPCVLDGGCRGGRGSKGKVQLMRHREMH